MNTTRVIIIALLLSLAALLVLSFLSLAESADTRSVEEECGRSHNRALSLSFDHFTEDRANRIAGKALSTDGSPLGAARVSVFDRHELEEASGRRTPDDWIFPVPEATTTTAPDGSYEFRSLYYGQKLVVIACSGYRTAQISPVVLVDGYGAEALDAVLGPTSSRRVVLTESNGCPSARQIVRLLPHAWSVSDVFVETNELGEFIMPRSVQCMSGEPTLLVGTTPVRVDISPGEADIEVVLPPRVSYLLQVPNAIEAEISLSIVPADSDSMGLTHLDVFPQGGSIRLDGLYAGHYIVIAAQCGRTAMAMISDISPEAVLLLSEPVRHRLHIMDQHGCPISARFTWQAKPIPSAIDLDRGPLQLVCRNDPTRISLVTDGDGAIEVKMSSEMKGWALLEASGYCSRIIKFPALRTDTEIELERGCRLYVRTYRPYLPVEIECPSQPAQVGCSNEHGECSAWLPVGPALVRSLFALGSPSYPVGVWVNGSEEPARITLADAQRRPIGCILGFVVDVGGAPLGDVDVFLDLGAGPSMKSHTDASGFYRFSGLQSRHFSIAARQKGDVNAVLYPETISLLRDDAGRETEVRQDLVLHEGTIQISDPDPVDTLILLSNEHDHVVWSTLVENRSARIANVAAGWYRVRACHNADDSGRELGHFEMPLHIKRPIHLTGTRP